MDLQPITVRHHLQSLGEAELIETFEEKTGSVGRPKILYGIPSVQRGVMYPKRRYMFLSNFMIKTIQSILGTKGSRRIFKTVGRNMGRNVLKQIEAESGLEEWTPEAYKNYFIEGYLQRVGATPEILSSAQDSITYRTHNCLFYELAVKMPETICEVIHDAFDEGISKAMGGNVTFKRRACKGHGDPYCEHECIWKQ